MSHQYALADTIPSTENWATEAAEPVQDWAAEVAATPAVAPAVTQPASGYDDWSTSAPTEDWSAPAPGGDQWGGGATENWA